MCKISRKQFHVYSILALMMSCWYLLELHIKSCHKCREYSVSFSKRLVRSSHIMRDLLTAMITATILLYSHINANAGKSYCASCPLTHSSGTFWMKTKMVQRCSKKWGIRRLLLAAGSHGRPWWGQMSFFLSVQGQPTAEMQHSAACCQQKLPGEWSLIGSNSQDSDPIPISVLYVLCLW